jgi:hypothetical protein
VRLAVEGVATDWSLILSCTSPAQKHPSPLLPVERGDAGAEAGAAAGVPKGTLAENVARVEAKEKIAAEAKAKAEVRPRPLGTCSREHVRLGLSLPPPPPAPLPAARGAPDDWLCSSALSKSRGCVHDI